MMDKIIAEALVVRKLIIKLFIQNSMFYDKASVYTANCLQTEFMNFRRRARIGILNTANGNKKVIF